MKYKINIDEYYLAWYKDYLLHRLYGPAVEYYNCNKHWCKDDKWHRLDGPAIEWSDGSKCWCIDGKKYTQLEYKQKIKRAENEI